MLIIKIHYGLGNQLFQYAFGRALSLRKNVPFALDLYFYHSAPQDPKHPRAYQLDRFCIRENIIPDDEVSKFIDPTPIEKGMTRLETLIRPYYKRRIVYERDLVFDENMWNVEDDAYLVGYWQDLRYFCDYEEQIREDLRFRQAPDGKDKELMEEIRGCNSVGIHVRRGDYLTDPFTLDLAGITSLDFYRRSVADMAGKVSDPRYFVFTDDPDWVRQNLDLGIEYQLVHHNDQLRAFEDMRLLSSCRHFILSNSSFSWWGAWLGEHKGKIVYAPAVWRRSGPNMYTPPQWNRI